MNERPDVLGVLDALAALPDRTPEQLAAYAVQRSAIEGATPFHEDVAYEDAAMDVLARLTRVKLSKAARRAITVELGVAWPVAL